MKGKLPKGRPLTGKAPLHREQLEYYLKAALGPLAKMYWMGRLDECVARRRSKE
jgi:hypothetical protein